MRITSASAFLLAVTAALFVALLPVASGCRKKNQAPDVPAVPSGPSAGWPDSSYSFSTVADDPDADSICYRFDWGDGQTSAWSRFVESGDPVSLTHSWSEPDTYHVKAQAMDGPGATSDWSESSRIVIARNSAPSAPAVPSGPTKVGKDSLCVFSSTATDPDGDSVCIRFDWGDGDTSDWSAAVGSGDAVRATHAWGDPGSYAVKAQARDAIGATSDWSSSLLVAVEANRPPNAPAVPSGPSTGKKDSLYEYTTITTDPDGDGVCYRFDWDDGDTSDWTAWVPSGDPGAASHAWSTGGCFEVKAQAKDANEALSTWSGAHAVVVPHAWDRTFGGAGSDDAFSVEQTPDSGYVVAGYTDSYGAGASDVWLIKTDASGSKSWDRTFGGAGYDRGKSVQRTADGGYIIVGETDSYGAGQYDVWLIKTDAAGNAVWDRTFGGDSTDCGNSVQQTSDGGYIIAGYTYSYGAGSYDIWLIKTDASGNKSWDRTFGGSDADFGYSVQQTADGGYVVAGHSYSYGAGEADVWLVKTDAGGNKSWDRAFGGTGFDEGVSVLQANDGGYIIAGQSDSYGASAYDVWLIKTDASGNRLWDRTFGGADSDRGRSVQQTSDGGYIVAGYTESYGEGYNDVWLVKTDASGNRSWDRTYGGSFSDGGHYVQQTSDGGYIIAGFSSTHGAGDSDVWLIKTDENGN